MQVADTGLLYNGIIPVPSPVIRVADTGLLYNGSAPFLSSQCLFLCHPSAYFFVIPVPRHWDLILLYNGSAPFLSSQCLFLCHPSAQTLGSRKKNGVMQVASFSCHPSTFFCHPSV
ncbi:MAG: hypothetical protein ACR5K5_04410 [Wolbachia sp.]